MIRHIPRSMNEFADFLSKLPTAQLSAFFGDIDEVVVDSFDAMLKSVHGGRSLHFGAYHTWKRVKEQYPSAHITLSAVQEWVRMCPTCQKTRDTGITGLPARTLSLKPPSYRKAIGVDHITVSPTDRQGNSVIILIVEHYSHFPQAYAASTYDADTLARTLFKHFCTFGLFDIIYSDPGSAFMSAVVAQLNAWLGVQHRVSLVDRHESNGCEATGREVIRHLRTLVMDERLIDRWSDDSVLPIINFMLASKPTAETGGFTPFQLKYGSEDAQYFRLPQTPDGAPAQPGELLRLLDDNLRLVRSISTRKQAELKALRQRADKAHTVYALGDLVLFDPKGDKKMRPGAKLGPMFMGPYRVTSQTKNDVSCVHVCTHDERLLHVSRLKPFFGSMAQAMRIAMVDRDQFMVQRINYFMGNVFVRKNIMFSVTFEDGDTVLLPYSMDLAQTVQFDASVLRIKALLPFCFERKEDFANHAAGLNKTAIPATLVAIGSVSFLDLRYFDGERLNWFETLLAPDHYRTYVTRVTFVRYKTRARTHIVTSVPLFAKTVCMSHTQVLMFMHNVFSNNDMMLVDDVQLLDAAFLDRLRPWIAPAMLERA